MEEKFILMENRILWLHETSGGPQKEAWFDRLRPANLSRESCATWCRQEMLSVQPNRPKPAERVRRPEAEPVRCQGSSPCGIQTRWAQKDVDKNSKQLPKGWLGVWVGDRAHLFPTCAGDVLASKSGSDPETPWKPLSATSQGR